MMIFVLLLFKNPCMFFCVCVCEYKYSGIALSCAAEECVKIVNHPQTHMMYSFIWKFILKVFGLF